MNCAVIPRMIELAPIRWERWRYIRKRVKELRGTVSLEAAFHIAAEEWERENEDPSSIFHAIV